MPSTEPIEVAKRKLDLFAEGRTVVTAHVGEYTYGQLWVLWLADRKADGKDNRIHDANWVSLAPVFAHKVPHATTRTDYRAYARARFDLGRAPDTVHTELIRLRQCVQWAYDDNLIEKPPKVWLPSAGRKRERVLTPEEACRLVIGARDGDPHIYLFVVLLFSTAGRHTAVLELEWDRVDFERGKIDLEIDVRVDPMSKAWRKGRAEMMMGKLAREALLEAYAGRRTNFVIEHGGKPLTTARDGFRNACERAGLGWYVDHPTKGKVFKTDVTPHTIRHSMATWGDDEDVNLKGISQLLGHADERTTRMIYIHAKVEKTAAAVSIIDARLAAAQSAPVVIDATPVALIDEADTSRTTNTPPKPQKKRTKTTPKTTANVKS